MWASLTLVLAPTSLVIVGIRHHQLPLPRRFLFRAASSSVVVPRNTFSTLSKNNKITKTVIRVRRFGYQVVIMSWNCRAKYGISGQNEVSGIGLKISGQNFFWWINKEKSRRTIFLVFLLVIILNHSKEVVWAADH